MLQGDYYSFKVELHFCNKNETKSCGLHLLWEFQGSRKKLVVWRITGKLIEDLFYGVRE